MFHDFWNIQLQKQPLLIKHQTPMTLIAKVPPLLKRAFSYQNFNSDISPASRLLGLLYKAILSVRKNAGWRTSLAKTSCCQKEAGMPHEEGGGSQQGLLASAS
jgi:hypothetical protein